jgi:hypothetical protein
MNSEQIRLVQDAATPNNDGHAEEAAVREHDAPQHARRNVSPYSLVPALTLIAMQFVKDEPSLIDLIINSAGSGQHRPVPR